MLVQVHAAGLDRGTWHLMTGKPYLLRLAFGLRGPAEPRARTRCRRHGRGRFGPAVTKFAVGDEVYGVAPGSFAEYAVAREDKLARKPANSPSSRPPWSRSRRSPPWMRSTTGRVEAGQHVLIIGASGGVGSYAVQLAKAFGAEVTGVASTAKLDLVRALGADHVIDYTREDFAETGNRYDLIIDIAGNPTLSRLRRALTPTGTAVITGGEEGGSLTGGMNRQFRALALSLFVRQRLTMFVNKERGSDLERLTDLIEAGKVTPSLDRTYPLDQVPDAMRHLDAGKARGKIAIGS